VTRGSAFFADAPAVAADSEHVRRLKRAGLVIFGRTNSCELGLSLTCEPALYGPTKNPWDTTRISGGSSGGAAAAVGARILPMAHASDGFGSIRAPASCCGIVGLKPTRSRNTMAPYAGEGLGGLATEHAVTLSVRDSAALLDATCGAGAGDPYVAPAPQRPFLAEAGAQGADHEASGRKNVFWPNTAKLPVRRECRAESCRRQRPPNCAAIGPSIVKCARMKLSPPAEGIGNREHDELGDRDALH
jgi:Asp-tRNA(Asn)/Glu-tRNA(Gln) amidotransferase A subunit family amidase